ncbi:MAG: hypothetical protein QM718_06390 [Steroidobacteraceae bacterium]
MNKCGWMLGAACVALGVQAAGAPDISGPWQASADIKSLKVDGGGAPPLTAKGQQLLKEHQARPDDDPIKRCLPPGNPRTMNQAAFPFNIVQGQKFYTVMFEWNHLPRVIYMTGAHFENLGPGYFGQSVGHWDGDTLVVDTNTYNDATWLDDSGLPHSDALHTVERIRLRDANTLEVKIRFEDPAIYSKPWSTTLSYVKKPGVVIKEDYCLGRTGQGTTVTK